MKKRQRREQDGLYLDKPDHWEMWETKIYRQKTRRQGHVTVPVDIVRHLNLENQDLVFCAIKRRQNKSVAEQETECWCYDMKRTVRIKGEIVGRRQAVLLKVTWCELYDICPKKREPDCLVGKIREGKW